MVGPAATWSRGAVLFGAGLLLLAALGVYARSLGAPFIFDDIPAVERNVTIRSLGSSLQPPVDGSGVSGRPLVNFSLAVDYALGGLDVRVYHATNLALHALAALTLWGLLRRTLQGLAGPSPDGPRTTGRSPLRKLDGELPAFSAALLWTVHPLLTESVVCVVQRNEILGSLFYLLTLYCFARAVAVERGGASIPTRSSPANRLQGVEVNAFHPSSQPVWLALSVLSCLAGMASKEIVATAPLLVLLYDRTFAAGTFGAAWRWRRKYYLGLAATWVLLGWLIWHNRQRGGTVGFGLSVGPWEYLLTQCRALVLYLQLSFWPHPLVLDYGWSVVHRLGEVWWQALLVVALLAATGVALIRKPVVGFLGACFFVILAPSSSFVPLTSQTIAEHRMYLPLAAVVSLVVAGAWQWGGRRARWGVAAGAVALGLVTMRRNADYVTELGIWTDTVAKQPENARAHGNLGRAYLGLGRWEEAIAACREEVRLAPDYPGDGRLNIARALTELGRPAEALPYFEDSLRLKPGAFDVHNNYGVALAALGRWADAVPHYEEALRRQPDFADAHNNLANALGNLGRADAALDHYAAALRLRPDFSEAEANLARTLAEAGRLAEALPYFEKVRQARPDSAEAAADLAQAHFGLGNILAAQGNLAAAVGHFESAVRLAPDLAAAHHNLAAALMQLGRPAEALPHFEATVRLLPGSADAHHELALVLGELHHRDEAIRQDEEALRLNPGFAEAREHRDWLRQQ